MGQKVNPYGFRLGFNKTWHSRWFSGKNYAETLHRDLKLREDLKKRLSHAGVSEIDIERTANKMRINIYTSRPGIIIGRKGAEVDKLRDELQKLVNGEVYINIQEIQRPELDSQLVAENIGTQLERRIASVPLHLAVPKLGSARLGRCEFACDMAGDGPVEMRPANLQPRLHVGEREPAILEIEHALAECLSV